jgi:hypothetical protein
MRQPVLPLLLLAVLLSACTVRREVSAPPVYSQASPYATHATPVVRDSYCAEAVSEAQAAAGRAAVSGGSRDANRAERAAAYARRDC